MSLLPAKAASVRADKMPSRPMTLGRAVLVYATSVFVAVLIAAALWVSVGAVLEKSKLARGVSQIVDLVDMSRQAATVEQGFGVNQREDILKRLARLKQIETAGESNGLSAVINPWNGALVAYTLPNNLFRVETIVPSRICERVIGLLAKNPRSIGLRQIDAKGENESQRQIYADSIAFDTNDIAAGCHSKQPVNLSLTFTLRDWK